MCLEVFYHQRREENRIIWWLTVKWFYFRLTAVTPAYAILLQWNNELPLVLWSSSFAGFGNCQYRIQQNSCGYIWKIKQTKRSICLSIVKWPKTFLMVSALPKISLKLWNVLPAITTFVQFKLNICNDPEKTGLFSRTLLEKQGQVECYL